MILYCIRKPLPIILFFEKTIWTLQQSEGQIHPGKVSNNSWRQNEGGRKPRRVIYARTLTCRDHLASETDWILRVRTQWQAERVVVADVCVYTNYIFLIFLIYEYRVDMRYDMGNALRNVPQLSWHHVVGFGAVF